MDFLSIPLPAVAISLALAPILLAAFVTIRRFGDEKKKRYHPVVGTVFNILISFYRLHDYMTDLAHRHKTYRGLNLFVSYVMTADPANVEYMLKTNFANYDKDHHHILSDVFGDGIFTVDGVRWAHQRKVSSYEISAKAVRDLCSSVFKTNAVKLARIVSDAATSNQALEIQGLFMKSTLDSIVKVLLGIELDTLCGTNEEGTRFSNALDGATELTIFRFVDFTWKIKRFLNIGSEAVLRKDIKVVDQFVTKLIKTKTEGVRNSSQDELPALKKGDIISRLVESGETDSKYMRDLILCLIAAGTDTTASTLAWFVYMLCKHPHVQKKIAEEVKEATNLKQNSSFDEIADSLTDEVLDKMRYLHAAFTETIRLYPAVPLNPKTCLSDDTWPDGFSVKKGTIVGFNSYAMGRMKYLWGDDAEEFRPERWLDKDGLFQQESPFKFTSFSAGPRICLGKDFAYREAKIFCAVLVGCYSFKLSDEKKVASYRTALTLPIDGGLHVQASPRFVHASSHN